MIWTRRGQPYHGNRIYFGHPGHYTVGGTIVPAQSLGGYVLGGVMLVLAITPGLSIVIGQVAASIKGIEPTWGLAVLFSGIYVAWDGAGNRILKNLRSGLL